MAVALASLATGRVVRSDVGMTGEVTLRGKVLPVGGIKEKVLAAHRACLKTVLLPRRNEKDLDDIPEEVRQEMSFVFIDTVADAIKSALDGKVTQRKRKSSSTKTRKKTSTVSKRKKSTAVVGKRGKRSTNSGN